MAQLHQRIVFSLSHEESRGMKAESQNPNGTDRKSWGSKTASEEPDGAKGSSMTIRSRTVSGLGWSASTRAATALLQFAVSVGLARLLNPDDFGLIGMVLVVIGFAATIGDLGFGAAIVQRDDISNASLSSVFWFGLAAGGFLTIALILAAPLVAAFYGAPQLQLLTTAMALMFIFGSLQVVQSALLQKSLDFRTRFRIEICSVSVSAVIALVLALKGAGVWSLVALSLSDAAARAVVTWRLVSWRPRLTFSWNAVKKLLEFGRHLIGFNIVVYWAQNVDKLIIGQHLGSIALGVYGVADRLMRLPLTHVTATTSAVMFPALAAVQSNVDVVRRTYLRANRMIAFLTFPMMLGMSTLAEPLVLLVYGEKWRAAIPVVQLLCFAGLAQSVYNTAAWIFLSRGRPDILFRLGLLSLLVRLVGVLVGLNWGLLGVACGYVAGGYLALLYPTWTTAGRLIGLQFAELLQNVAAPFFCAATMAAAIGFSHHLLWAGEADWLQLAVHVPAGIVVYGLCARLFRLRAWYDFCELISEVAGPRTSRLLALINKRID